MDIQVENQAYNTYQKIYSGEKVCKLSADMVIPDTFDDVSKLLTAEFSFKIISKDVGFGKLTVSGEVTANTLFIPENAKSPESVLSNIPFTAEFMAEDIDSSSMAVASLRLVAADWRELNPRKVGLNVDISVEVEAFSRVEVRIPAIAADTSEKTYFKHAKKNIKNTSLISEKLATVEDERELVGAAKILSSDTKYYFDNSELVGNRVIVKGHAHSRIIFRKDDGSVASFEYDTAFSQLLDYESDAGMSECELTILPAGEYYELRGTTASMELRVVLELICYEDREVEYIADAYVCGCGYELVKDDTEVSFDREVTIKTGNTLLTYELPEGFGNVFISGAGTGKITMSGNMVNVPVSVSAISTDGDNNIISFKLRGNAEFEDISCENAHAWIEGINCAAVGGTAQFDIAVTLKGVCTMKEKISAVSAISVNTEITKIIAPSLYIVRAEDSDIWEIAKKYGADKDRISELNSIAENEDIKGKMLLVPKA